MMNRSATGIAFLALFFTTGCATDAVDVAEPEPIPDPPSAAIGLWEVSDGPGAPFLLSPPVNRERHAPVVLFVPGGAGIRDHAMPTFERWLSKGKGREQVWLLVPYTQDGDLSDEGERVQTALRRVIDERASERSPVHLAGTSNGGRSAFRWLLEQPERYTSFLGAPALPAPDPGDEALGNALAQKRVLLAVGSEDGGWLEESRSLEARLGALGIDCQLMVFEGEGHILSEEFDESVFFEFWLAEEHAR